MPGFARQAVTVGAGPAGDAVAAGFRDAGFTGGIALVGAERELPYERPHLSKGYLVGTVSRDRLPLRPSRQYSELEIDLELGDRVLDLGLPERTVLLESGKTIGWDLLGICTGSDARKLSGFEDALYLRELPSADRLRAMLGRAEMFDIAGAGFIGCEVAAVPGPKGGRVRLSDTPSPPMARVLGPEGGACIARPHCRHGVQAP